MTTLTLSLFKENESVREYAYRTLRENILKLKLKPGDKISEKEISDTLSISRTPVREAFIRLSQEQLLEVLPQRGTYISKINTSQIAEFRFLRVTLEQAVMKLACEKFPPEYQQKIIDCLEEQSTCEKMKLNEVLDELVIKNRPISQYGNVANYIPELDKAQKDALGIFITDITGNKFHAGDWNTKFTIQSISKIVTLMLAILDNGEEYVFSKVGMEPTGDPFNSIVKLETSRGRKPYNPMINAGAIAVSSMIKGKDAREKFERLLDFFKLISEDSTLDVNYKIYCGEAETGNRNRAMGYFLKSEGIIDGNVEDALTVYFKQCSIEVTAETLSKIALFLVNNGKISTGETIIPPRVATIIKTLMVTCGMYDSSGEFAIRVGIPSKSGVGGGILSVVPGKMAIGVYGPSLDEKGNPIAGVALLEDLSKKLNLTIF